MHIIVTGGAGFIGSHVVSRLLESGQRVTVIDNFDPFYPENVKQRNIEPHRDHPSYCLVRADIRNGDVLHEAIPADTDAIVHLAAKAGVRPSIQCPLSYQETNVTGTHNLLEIARARRIRKFVFASSSSVYGVNPNVPWREEDTVLMPISPYASTKVSCELLGHVYSHLFGIQFLALRFFTVYGPGQRPDLAIHKFATLMENGERIPVFGDGSTRRDYTYVDDIVSGITSAISYDRSIYEVINLGNDRTVTLLEMIRGLEVALGMCADLEMMPEQPGDVPRTWADIGKAGRLLGYSPSISFAEGLARFANWFKGTTGTTELDAGNLQAATA
jgi:UDP-glucuronate 4-epimerase